MEKAASGKVLSHLQCIWQRCQPCMMLVYGSYVLKMCGNSHKCEIIILMELLRVILVSGEMHSEVSIDHLGTFCSVSMCLSFVLRKMFVE